MKKIQITYSTSELGTALYMVLFFRSVGVYVYEKIINSRMRHADQVKYPSIEADLEIIILDEKEFSRKRSFADQGKCICLVKKSAGGPGEKIASADHVIFMTSEEKNENVLFELIEEIAHMDKQDAQEKESLLRLARIYDKHHIMEAMLSTRFYYGLEDHYPILYQYYESAVREIGEKIANPRIRHSNYEYYAFVYYAYEIDYYCKRLNVSFIFNAEKLLSLVMDLRDLKRAKWNTWDLLMAQIYGDLKNDIKNGYQYYESSVLDNDSNSFAWYKMGEIWKEEYKDYERAKQCFERAVSISPIYYKAVYKQAECSYQLGKREEALKQYEYVIRILNQRIIGGAILPMHIEYAFTTYFHMGRIWSGDMNAPFQAISAYKNAEEIWNSIESVEEKDIVLNFISKRKSTESLMRELYKKEKQLLDIKAVYERLAALYLMIGEKRAADDYTEKIKNETT